MSFKKSLPDFFILIVIVLFSCGKKKETLFTKLPSSKSGIEFKNTINEMENDTTMISEFAYMGGGVGIGDFNNDGLKDIFFSANQESSRLYINKGDNKFEDITNRAGIATQVWATGVSIADINADGFDDIYVCVYGKTLTQPAKNLLFINQHDLTFKEQASEYGLADSSYSTQASFFDYDKDGDLDVYLLNYNLGTNANYVNYKDVTGNSIANDKLYRNDGDTAGLGHPYFRDVSKEAGIKEDGYGLGVSITDVDGDNWPDIYVSNDFVSNDELWMNNRNGTFTNQINQALKHQAYSSMGCDAADMNNDALPDIAAVDMMPELNERKKLTYSFMNYERYELERSMKYEPEFMRNMLQLNNGLRKYNNDTLPFFSEIGQLAGINETDWSWSILMADFNNDGWKDIHITNGIGRDYINSDFVQFRTSLLNGQAEAEQRKMVNEELRSLKPVALTNYLYLNNRNYSFTDFTDDGGIDEATLSSGAAYADLDNDGDLDVVVNNINKEAHILINNTANTKDEVHHYVAIQTKGNTLNPYGYGSKVYVYSGNEVQLQEQNPVRGYLSSVDRTLFFGLGEKKKIDSVVVIWPNDKKQVVNNPSIDKLITLNINDASEPFTEPSFQQPELFTETSSNLNILYKHMDVTVNDFAMQRLLPQKYSQLGPFLTKGDVNNDQLEDFFVGGGFNSAGMLFIQTPDGKFIGNKIVESNEMIEDMDCQFLDVDNDKDEDLLITCGDMRFEDTSSYYQPRLFLNDGRGNFAQNYDAIPSAVRTIAGCVTANDFDKDGDLDVFIGGRISAHYPKSPRSFLLQNNKGKFTDVTQKVCPALQNGGMITSAAWIDFDNDKTEDLVVAGDWMPLRFFSNKKGKFTETTNTGLKEIDGMWRSLIAADVDKDGDLDLVAGNLGQNCKYRITPQTPMKLFAKDIDKNGSIDPVPFYHIRNGNKRELFPAINRDQLAEQVPAFKKQFLKHMDFTTASVDDIFKDKTDLIEHTCNEVNSCFFENLGNGKFVKHYLPTEAQFAPVNAIICDDLDGDGLNDLLLAGNEYQTEVMTGRYDASYGVFLKGGGKKFTYIPPTKTGFIIDGDVKDLVILHTRQNQKLIVAAVNNDSLKVFRLKTKEKLTSLSIR